MRRLTVALIAAGASFAAFWTSASAQNVSPTFNCNQRLNPSERTICNNNDLAYLDQDMVAVYNQIPQFVSGSRWNRIKSEQRSWLKTRDSCGRNVDCLRRTIGNRIDVLNTYLPGDLPDQVFNPPPPPPPPSGGGQGGIGGIFGNQGQGQTFQDVTATYVCDSGAQVQVTFVNSANPQTATLLAGGQYYVLQDAISGSGFRYTNGSIELLGKGQEITLLFGGQSVNCYER